MVNLVFDYDGTIHDSINIYAQAFKIAYDYLVVHNFAKERDWTNEEISRWLGHSAKDMWNLFMPSLPQEVKDKCSKRIGEEMLRLIKDGKAKLYSGAEDVLKELKAHGYNLIFLSNCKRSYMEAHKSCFPLEKYFSAFYCTEDYDFIPKWDIFRSIKKDFEGEFIIIGDRFQDIEIALKFGIKSVGCKYGYGSLEELKGATALVLNIAQLPHVIYSFETSK